MLKKTTHQGLPRRVSAYFLMFGLATVVWLAVGIVMVSQSLIESHSETGRVTTLVKAAADAAGRYRRGGAEPLREFIGQLNRAHSLEYCAVVDPDGKFLAHSDPVQVGRSAPLHTGAVEQWGESERIRFMNEDSRPMREYRSPVRSADRSIGVLVMTYREPGVWGVILAAAEYAPIAVLGPFFLMALGVFVLQRTVRPISRIEVELERLANAPSLEDAELPILRSSGAPTAGWNRLAEHFNTVRDRHGIDSRLATALEGFRQRKADRILNTLPDGIALTDDQGRITLANQSLAALLGAGADGEALSGRRMEDLLKFRAEGDAPQPFLDPAALARTVVVEIARGDEASREVLRVARYPLRSSKNAAVTSHVWSVRDVTQQKLADQMRTQFVHSATHELRTPLTNIKAYAETLALSDMLDTERQKEFCNTINAEATRLARFIDDLLSLSSIESGALSLARQETDMERLLREVLDKVRPQMTLKSITLRHSVPDKIPKLRIDKDKIIATLVNLLGNAAKYTPEGGNVFFRVAQKEDSLQIDVEDTGIGIASEEIPKLFDRFYRSSDPRVQEQTGTGLGLSLAHEVVRLHGGKILVQSELNKGTRFTVVLPID